MPPATNEPTPPGGCNVNTCQGHGTLSAGNPKVAYPKPQGLPTWALWRLALEGSLAMPFTVSLLAALPWCLCQEWPLWRLSSGPHYQPPVRPGPKLSNWDSTAPFAHSGGTLLQQPPKPQLRASQPIALVPGVFPPRSPAALGWLPAALTGTWTSLRQLLWCLVGFVESVTWVYACVLA